MRIKVEINTHERSPALPPIRLPFEVASPWWSGTATVPTFQLPELIATKIRAFYQRSKGRDLFDMWLALTQTAIDPTQVLAAFEPYRPAGYTAELAITNLRDKLANPDFRNDVAQLASQSATSYDPDRAAELVLKALIADT